MSKKTALIGFLGITFMSLGFAKESTSQKKGETKIYESTFKLMMGTTPYGDYEEKLYLENGDYRFEYLLSIGSEGGEKRSEALVAFAKKDPELTPVRYSLTFEIPGKVSQEEHWIRGEAQKDKFKIQTRVGTNGMEYDRKFSTGVILSSFLPLKLLNTGGLKTGSVVQFQALDEEGKIGGFKPVGGTAKIGDMEKVDGVDARKIEVIWGGVASVFWVKSDGSLAKMTSPSTKLTLKRIQ